MSHRKTFGVIPNVDRYLGQKFHPLGNLTAGTYNTAIRCQKASENTFI